MEFLLITRTDWNEPPRARHQLAKALAKNYKVVFIAINTTGKPSLEVNKVHKNLIIITPSWYINGKIVFRIPLINEVYQMWLFSKLKKEYKNFRVINFDPSAALIHKYFDNVVYFCNDNFLDSKRSKSVLVSKYISITQKIVAKNAQFCVSTSYYLRDTLSKYNKNSHLLLTAAVNINTKIPKFNIKKKYFNIVYVGWLFKLNRQWILDLAKNNNYTIYLIGPNANVNIEEFQKTSNIIITGTKKGNDLYHYLMEADVCIAPYNIDDDTKKAYTMPNKFWLYIYFGKPVVTCEIKNIYKEIPDKFIYQAKNSIDFTRKIATSINENTIFLTEKRKIFIQKNTWDNRVNQLIYLYNND